MSQSYNSQHVDFFNGMLFCGFKLKTHEIDFNNSSNPICISTQTHVKAASPTLKLSRLGLARAKHLDDLFHHQWVAGLDVVR